MMSDSRREQRPLLCDHGSDEEFHVENYTYQQYTSRPSVRRGRAQNFAKGAATVITRWPDNCSTSVTYWWLGVSMIAITVFVIYNSVLIFGMIPRSDIRQPKYRTYNNEIKPKAHLLSVPDVYMHLVINNSSDVILNKYLPHTKIVSKKYPSFNYKFLVIFNDTSDDIHSYNDQEKNEIALNSLWENENHNKKIYAKYNISVEHISLTAYLNDSPIKKFWRHLPPHLIVFLVRSVSIWEKGGIAFNPEILIPNHSYSKYIEKIYQIFNNFIYSSNNTSDRKVTPHIYADVSTKRPNNIRDIINALNRDDNNISNIDLSEADTNNDVAVSNTENILKYSQNSKANFKMEKHNSNLTEGENLNKGDTNLNKINHVISKAINNTLGENVLPLFLKYLLENKHKNEVKHLKLPSNKNVSFFNESHTLPIEDILRPSKKQDEYYNSNTKVSENPNKQEPEESTTPKVNKYVSIPELYIDIKGNIIASKTGCHAFLGTMFSNVIRHTEEETITDFIISELSLFCDGILKTCAAIEMILV